MNLMARNGEMYCKNNIQVERNTWIDWMTDMCHLSKLRVVQLNKLKGGQQLASTSPPLVYVKEF